MGFRWDELLHPSAVERRQTRARGAE